MTGQENRIKVQTAKHANFLEKRARMARNEEESGLYRLSYGVTGAWTHA